MAITVYRIVAGKVAEAPVAELGALLAANEKLWIDADGSGDGLPALLTEVLKLHPLAVEDILTDRPSPKVEDYGDYLYVVTHGVVHDKDTPGGTIKTVELDVVLSKQWLFTHHEGKSLSCGAVREELARTPRLLEQGPAFVAHAVLDHIVDYYLPVVDGLDDTMDELETRVVESASKEVLTDIFRLKRSLQALRRIAVHQREVLHRLSRGEFALIPLEALPFFRDVYDHFVRVADLADSYRDMLSNALDAYLSVVSNRMNEIMKRLTLVATVFMPLTFIVGLYGMNFEHMPELHWRYGYAAVWGVLIVVAIAMVVWFQRKKWLS